MNRIAVGSIGIPGRSAADEAERRRQTLRREAEIIWGDEAAGDVHEDAWTTAYELGADGERRLGPILERLVSGSGWVLHDRVASQNANIDHIVVAPSGVWVVDSKNYRGRVRAQRRGLFGQPCGVRVNGSDRTDLVNASRWQVDLVRSAIDQPQVPVHLVLAFPRDSAFGWFSKSFRVDDVWCCPPGQLAKRIVESPAVLSANQLNEITGQLSVRLPAR